MALRSLDGTSFALAGSGAIREHGLNRPTEDVDSIRASGRFSDAELIRSAVERDPGFEVPMFVIQLELVHRVLPEQVSQYNVDADQLDGIKNRFDLWASTLRADIPDLDEHA